MVHAFWYGAVDGVDLNLGSKIQFSIPESTTLLNEADVEATRTNLAIIHDPDSRLEVYVVG